MIRLGPCDGVYGNALGKGCVHVIGLLCEPLREVIISWANEYSADCSFTVMCSVGLSHIGITIAD